MTRLLFNGYLLASCLTLVHGDDSIVYLNPYLSYAGALLFLVLLCIASVVGHTFATNYWPYAFVVYVLFLVISLVVNGLTYFDIGSLFKGSVLILNSILLVFVFFGNRSDKYVLLKDWRRFNVYFGMIVAIPMFLELVGLEAFKVLNNHDELIRPFPIFSNSGIIFEPNVAAILLFVGWYFLFERFKGAALLFWNVIFLSAIFLTYSRAVYLLVIFALVLRFRIVLLAAIPVALYAIYLYIDTFLEFANVENLLTGRPGMWYYCLTNAPNPLFGFGFSPGKFNDLLRDIGPDYVTSHNVLIDMYLSNGVFTSFSFLVFFVSELFRNYYLKSTYKYLGIMVALFVLISPSNFGGLSIISINFSILLLESRWKSAIS